MSSPVSSSCTRSAAACALLLLAASSLACLGRPQPPPPPAAAVTVEAGETTVEVERATGVLRVLRGDVEIAQLGAPGCGPFRLALRPPTDDGTRYHDVEIPPADLDWYSASDVAVSGGQGAIGVVWTLASESGGGDDLTATAVIRPGAEGFVHLDLTFDVPERGVAMGELCLPISSSEHFVGGGERFDGVDLRGRIIPLAFRAPGPYASSTNETHAPVPWIASTSGLGLLVETERVGAFDVGATEAGQLRARFAGNTLPLRIRAGVSDGSAGKVILDNVAAHNRFMGLPPLPPTWVLAPQQWRNEHSLTLQGGVVVSDGRDRFLEDARTMRTLDLPASTLWIDAPWSTGYNTFTFNAVQFPDAPSMLQIADALGYRVIVWATERMNNSDDSDQQFGMPPFASQGLYRAFAQAGYLVSTNSGEPFTFPWARGGGGFVDFTHRPAVEAWKDQIRPLLQMGIRGFKLDYGETMRADFLGTVMNDLPVFADGSTTAVQHTRYARLYHEAFLEVLEEVHPGDHFIITRTGGIYDQRNGVAIWPGDLDNDFSRAGEIVAGEDRPAVGGLPAAISAALSLSMSGYPLYGSDIGGYRGGAPTTEVLLRWTQFGALSTIMQLGGGGTGDSTHNPWDADLYDATIAVPIYRRYAALHLQLVPYLESLLLSASEQGTPPLIPLGVYAPSDEAAWADADAFLLGPDLLVFPVVEPDATERTIHLPAGVWLDWWTGEQLEGPLTTTVPAPLDHQPLYQRAGSVLPLHDERLMTVVTAEDPNIVGPGFHPDRLVVRTISGQDGETLLRDGTRLIQRTVGRGTEVRVEGNVARQYLFEHVLRSDQVGPWPSAQIRTGLLGTSTVPNYEDLFTCLTPCTHRAVGRLYALMDGPSPVVVFGEELPSPDATAPEE